MSDDALAQAMLNPTSLGDGFGPEARSKGEADELNDLVLQEPTTDDELGSDLDDDDDDDEGVSSKPKLSSRNRVKPSYTSASRRIATSNARTGPKGVLRDRHESDQAALKAQREALIRNKKLDFSTLTIEDEEKLKRKEEREEMRRRGEIDSDDQEEDEERNQTQTTTSTKEEDLEIQNLRRKRLEELKMREREMRMTSQGLQQQRRRGLMSGAVSSGRWFGHLREVDEKGFVKAVEEDGEGTWVVVHIYGKSVPACIRLTSSLSSLARLHPRTKFLQVKASSIGFGSSTSNLPTTSTSLSTTEVDEDDEEETQLDDEDYEGLGEQERFNQDEANDVLPTILIYKKGQLEANLVRPDLLEEEWRGGDERGVREILIKYGVLSTNSFTNDDFSYAWNDQARGEDE